MKKVVLLLSVIVAANAFAESKCLDKGKIRYRKFGEMVTEEAALCFDKEKGNLESASCSKKGCEALNALSKKSDAKPATGGTFGTPGFHACRAAGGEPQIVEYHDGKDWVPTDRCVFKGDSSFINTTRLLSR